MWKINTSETIAKWCNRWGIQLYQILDQNILLRLGILIKNPWFKYRNICTNAHVCVYIFSKAHVQTRVRESW